MPYRPRPSGQPWVSGRIPGNRVEADDANRWEDNQREALERLDATAPVVVLSQAEYDDLDEPDPATVYVIV